MRQLASPVFFICLPLHSEPHGIWIATTYIELALLLLELLIFNCNILIILELLKLWSLRYCLSQVLSRISMRRIDR
jgi:hypothetical protein